MRLDKHIGSVEKGKRAHLLLLRANPLESVEAYNSIETVFLAGKAIPRDTLCGSGAQELSFTSRTPRNRHLNRARRPRPERRGRVGRRRDGAEIVAVEEVVDVEPRAFSDLNGPALKPSPISTIGVYDGVAADAFRVR